MAAGGWQESVNGIRVLLNSAPLAGGVPAITDVLRPQLAENLVPVLKENNRAVFTIGQFEPVQAAAMARAGLVKWWHAFAGAAYFGKADNLRQLRALHDADTGAGDRHDNFDSTLSWAAHPHSVTEGSVARMDRETVALLIEWGADVNYSEGKYLGYVLHQSPAEIIRLYLDNGAPKQSAEVARGEELAKKNYLQAQRLDEALGGDGITNKVDAQTLMQTQFIGEPEGVATLKTIYNFRTRRVNEIYTPPGKDAAPAMTSSDFSIVDTSALRRAQEMLEKIGGKPAEALEKPKLKGLGHG